MFGGPYNYKYFSFFLNQMNTFIKHKYIKSMKIDLLK